jgi:phospholipid-binding lipoprotein MlaA
MNRKYPMHALNLIIKRVYIASFAAAVFILLLPAANSFANEAAKVQSAGQTESTSAIELQEAGDNQPEEEFAEDEWEEDEWDEATLIADPLEPINRLFFFFNDKLYFWVLKPVTKGYSAILAEDVRILVRNFFDNLRTPTRVVNNLLQGKVRKSAEELGRFVLNSTVGIFGLGDFAGDVAHLHPTFEDTGQTLARYGLGGGFYINWPFLGPSNLRDSFGMLGDAYLHPMIFLDASWPAIIGAWSLDKVNYTSFTLGDYELFTETALDPYTTVKDAYQQYRKGLIEDK